jgi:SAM-dependent methyltransferase
MKPPPQPSPRPPYNDRLFRSGLRRRFHLARFAWVARTLRTLNGLGAPSASVLEVGCFDGRLLDHLPPHLSGPLRYKGFDANWEGGLDRARETRSGPGRTFLRAARAAEMEAALAPSERFDVAVALETLEHVPPDQVEPYLEVVARHLDGHLLISVPNEIGTAFLVRWLVKRLGGGSRQRHSPAEVLWAFLGQTRRIARHEHKGFDYRELVAQVGRHFDIVSVVGIPGERLPLRLSFTIGIVARSRLKMAA